MNQVSSSTTRQACPHCAGQMLVAVADLGKAMRCPHCGGIMQTAPLPLATPAYPPAAPADAHRQQQSADEQRRAARKAATAVAAVIGAAAGLIIGVATASVLPEPQGSAVGIGLALFAGLLIGGAARGIAELLLPRPDR